MNCYIRCIINRGNIWKIITQEEKSTGSVISRRFWNVELKNGGIQTSNSGIYVHKKLVKRGDQLASSCSFKSVTFSYLFMVVLIFLWGFIHSLILFIANIFRSKRHTERDFAVDWAAFRVVLLQNTEWNAHHLVLMLGRWQYIIIGNFQQCLFMSFFKCEWKLWQIFGKIFCISKSIKLIKSRTSVKKDREINARKD